MMTKQRIAAAIYYRFIKKGWFDFLNYELYRLQANRFEKCKNKTPFFSFLLNYQRLLGSATGFHTQEQKVQQTIRTATFVFSLQNQLNKNNDAREKATHSFAINRIPVLLLPVTRCGAMEAWPTNATGGSGRND